MNVKQMLAEIETKSKEVTKLFDAEDAEKAKNPDFVMAGPDRERVKTLHKEIEELEHRVVDAQEMDGIRGGAQERVKKLSQATDDVPVPGGAGRERERKERPEQKSIGQQFVESADYKAWLKQIAPNGQIADSTKGFRSPSIEAKDLITGASLTSAGAMVRADRVPGVIELPMRPVTIFDLITNGTTDSDTVEYVRVSTLTNNAAPTAEATAATGTSGTKPESAMALVRVTTTVKTIAHWIPATKRALSDAGQLRTLIDGFLRQGVREEMADQVLTGNGVGENFTGILNTAGLTAQAWDTNILTTTRKARTKVRTVGRAAPTGYVFNPTDWETIDLLTDNENRYYFGGPSVLGTPRLWGLPVAEEEGLTVGRGLVGDMRQAVLWDRQQATIQASDSHSDFFVRNLVAVLAEARAAFGVFRPAAIVDIDLTAV